MPIGRRKPKVRILHFRRIFSLLSESFLYEPLRYMREAGRDVRMLCLVRMNAHQRPFATSSLVTAPLFLHSSRLLGLIFSSRFGRAEGDTVLWPFLRPMLLRRIRSCAPHVIHAHFGPDGCLIAPVAEKLGIPLVVSFYGYDVSRLITQTGETWLPRYRRLFEQASLLVGISGYMVERLRELGAPDEKLRTIPLGVHLDRFTYRDPASGYADEPVRCLHVGRLTPKKNPLKLLQAFARARAILKNTRGLELVIIGDGELKQACAREVARLHLQPFVRLPGALPHDKIAAHMGHSHIYIQYCETAPDGDKEGLGVTFIEAQACGLPVLSTRHNGVPEVVLHGITGLLSDEGDVDALARNLVTLALKPELWTRYGRQGREHVLENYSLPCNAERLAAATLSVLPHQAFAQQAHRTDAGSPLSVNR